MRRLLTLLSSLLLLAGASAQPRSVLRTPDGKHEISRIRVTAVYFVPGDREPLPDWEQRVRYFARRIEAFHRRELDAQSALEVEVLPQPLRSPRSTAEFRGGDQNRTFFTTMEEVRRHLEWPTRRDAFPVLLVLSDINWRELDDFRRERIVDGAPRQEGHVSREGRHFPGAESGGARALYLPQQGIGLGLVSADGWRVPYSGSDCVVYHEGVGHPIGLPHPDPIDDSVMGAAQYRFWLNEAFLAERQKRALGWVPGCGELRSPDLFTAFTALPEPPVPAPGQPVRLRFTWPPGAKVKSLVVRYQTDLKAPWRSVPAAPAEMPREAAPAGVPLGTFERPTPVSYRAEAMLEDGQTEEIWGYFQVREPR